MDNAPIHRKTAIRELVEETEIKFFFSQNILAYLNDIEHDFSALKRARMYAPPGTSLDELICAYCAQ
jgi:transposase